MENRNSLQPATISHCKVIRLSYFREFILWCTANWALFRSNFFNSISADTTYIIIGFVLVSIAYYRGGGEHFLGLKATGSMLLQLLPMLFLALIVIIIGGVGTVQGALLGAMMIGIIDSLGKVYFPDFALFTIYLAMIFILLFRPQGLLGRLQ